ncbi:MAG: DUF4832 domain-containing protein [Limisphaerales bacterium]
MSALFALEPSTPPAQAEAMVEHVLACSPGPSLNPLKGFVPYAGQGRDFPHSLEFNYLPLAAVMEGPTRFVWAPLDKLLNDIASRGCQAIFRVYLEYPRKPSGIPQYLLDAGLRIHTYTNTNTQPFPPALVTTPDYEDPQLRAALTNFIAALGSRYDGDPRLGFVTAGLLGTWGEWHTHPRNDLWASQAAQVEVMEAYQAAFHRTPVLLRYPAGDADPVYAANHRRPLGYHDDSFAWATLPTERKEDAWFFLPRLLRAGPEAVGKWRTQPIGGEIRPEVWAGIWDEPSSTPAGQEFLACVETTHASWLMDSSTSRPLTPGQRQRALTGAGRLGYEFCIPKVEHGVPFAGRDLAVKVFVRNVGVAPFYHDWPFEFATLANGAVRHTWASEERLSGLLPGDPDRVIQTVIPRDRLDPGRWQLALRVVNPLANGVPLRFGGPSQDQHRPGWFTLAEINLK